MTNKLSKCDYLLVTQVIEGTDMLAMNPLLSDLTPINIKVVQQYLTNKAKQSLDHPITCRDYKEWLNKARMAIEALAILNKYV